MLPISNEQAFAPRNQIIINVEKNFSKDQEFVGSGRSLILPRTGPGIEKLGLSMIGTLRLRGFFIETASDHPPSAKES